MHNKNVSFSLLVSALIILLQLSGCSQSQQEKLVTPAQTNNIAPTPQILPSATNTVGQSQVTLTKTLTPTSPPKVNCPVRNSNVTIFEGETISEIEQAILDYLNQGGFPEQLQTELKKLQDTSIVGPTQVFIVDTNSDGLQEIVLAINFTPPVGGDYMDIHGNVHIYNCADGKYNDTEIVEGYFADTQKILAVENLLGSDPPEILISRRYTYLDIYFEAVEMYMFKEGGWALFFNSEEIPCGIQTQLKNGSSGHKELIIVGSSDCSNNNDKSPTSKKWTYAFEENEVKLIREELYSSP